MFGIKRKPCVSVLGCLVHCGTPTFRRASDGTKMVPVCKSCGDYSGEIIETLYDVELGITDSLYGEKFNPHYHRFDEVELSDCKFGCKIYESQQTGRRVLAHNSAYGCTVQF